MMNMLKIPDDMPIENKMISKSIESAQKKVEGRNFDIRKHLVEYDDVINHHRTIIYKKRREILENENIKNEIILLIEQEIESIVLMHTNGDPENWNYQEIAETVNAIHRNPAKDFNIDDIRNLTNREDIIERIKLYFFDEYEAREKMVPDPELLRRIEKNIYLHVIDTLWMEHITNLNSLRENVSLRGYGQRDPLIEYKQEAFITFERLMANITSNVVNTLFKVDIERQVPVRVIQADQPTRIMTNESDIKEVLSGHEKSGGSNLMRSMMQAQAQKNAATPQAIDPRFKNVGRNDPCPCGSGKKFKKCHGA